MLASWVIFPLFLLALSFGCGVLVERTTGPLRPGPLTAPIGFMVVVVVTGVLTSRGETAPAATPVAVVLALVGLFFLWRDRGGGYEAEIGWACAAALGAFAVYAAPVVLSGEPTFAGYIKLDDTATWMAFVDRVMEHGRDLAGLAPSTYERTLEVNLPGGYPVGAFLPLGVGSRLTGTDVAWLVQPYMATMAALLALCLYQLAEPLLSSRPLRALVAFGAAQPALLFAYSLWGGIKEVAVALAIALLVAVSLEAVRRESGVRGVIPLALATAALLTMVGSGGLVWILPALALLGIAVWRTEGLGGVVARALPLLLLTALFAIPALFAAGVFSPTQGGLTSDAELGNLIAPLSVFQYAGIWPTGDFRLDPVNEPLTVFLIALAIAAAVGGAVLCWRSRAWGPLLYAAAAGTGSLAVFAYSSPWVGAKALASAGPSLLLLALAGAAAFALRVERLLGGTVLALILAGVLWSNALGYHDVSLAPYDQLRELEQIGEEISGQGPTLMTEYQPYGVRHFLRDADAEGASELRSRPVPLVEGGELEKGAWGDTDQLTLSALLAYPTLVLRRSPAQSRPPSAYSLVREGDYYDVWQRPDGDPGILGHFPLGSFEEPAARSCAAVEEAAALAGTGGTVAAAERRPALNLSLGSSAHPDSWLPTEPGSPDLVPGGAGTATLPAEVPRSQKYNLYLLGSIRNRLDLVIDGITVGSVEEQLNPSRQFLDFGEAWIGSGPHRVELVLHGQTLRPGSGGPPEPIGPLVLDPTFNENPPVREVPADQATSLCSERLDWVEARP
jgi:hypothetical protein